jgi:hypothetical protein
MLHKPIPPSSIDSGMFGDLLESKTTTQCGDLDAGGSHLHLQEESSLKEAVGFDWTGSVVSLRLT